MAFKLFTERARPNPHCLNTTHDIRCRKTLVIAASELFGTSPCHFPSSPADSDVLRSSSFSEVLSFVETSIGGGERTFAVVETNDGDGTWSGLAAMGNDVLNADTLNEIRVATAEYQRPRTLSSRLDVATVT